ncbi:hypothetical protein ASZ90_011214 [hydrocarbon metagenome]|uniref:Uncharacterized protein n=1 Tax=hydrocarbon metagenome TaxID=938273 RepID=A0A0W8FDX4_9ZZZZ
MIEPKHDFYRTEKSYRLRKRYLSLFFRYAPNARIPSGNPHGESGMRGGGDPKPTPRSVHWKGRW